jgi:hypothetical protein
MFDKEVLYAGNGGNSVNDISGARMVSLVATDGFPDRIRDPGDADSGLDTRNPRDIESDFWEAADSGLFGSLEDYLEVDGEAGEMDLAGAWSGAAESGLFAPGHTPHLTQARFVTEYLEELDPTQIRVFHFLADHVLALFRKTGKKKPKLLRWIFNVGGELEGVSFEDCCLALECRPWLMRLRIHLEFWVRDMRLDGKVPGFIVPLPGFVLEEGYACGQDAAVRLLHRIWEYPGVSTVELLRDAGDRTALEMLEESGLIVSAYGGSYWYCVGRSPLNKSGRPRAQSWGSLWRNF